MNIRCVSATEMDASDTAAYVDALNACFGRWGDLRRFDWAFRRVMSGLAADILIADEGGRAIAGSAITYRSMRKSDGTLLRAAIITGAWTRPEARGRGAFVRLIRASHEVATDRGAACLLGFGLMENPSSRSVEHAGSAISSAWYLRRGGTKSPHVRWPALEPSPALFPSRGSHFVYTDAEWRTQFLARPDGDVQCVGVPGEWTALLERHATVDRVLLHSGRAIEALAGTPLFLYSTDAEFASSMRAAGFEATPGFLSSLPAAGISDWAIQNGDRM